MSCDAFLISTQQPCPVRRCAMRSNISMRRAAALPHPAAHTDCKRPAWTDESVSLAAPPGARRHHGRKVRGGQEVAMFGGEGRKDALLVPGTTRVRDVMELLIELDGGLG